MGAPNRAIKRVRHVIPTIEDLRHDVNGAKVFSKLDLAKGFHQLELHEDSRGITTFSTHAGLRRFRRLNFGAKLGKILPLVRFMNICNKELTFEKRIQIYNLTGV